MTDLIERLRHLQGFKSTGTLAGELADALEAKDAEIERLQEAAKNYAAAAMAKQQENAKLQAVVERIATRDYDETAQEFARAALEDE